MWIVQSPICVTVRCWPGQVHRSIASFTPVRAEWPCQPRATSKMSRLEATRCSSQVGVSKRMIVIVHILAKQFFVSSTNKKISHNKLVLFCCQQESEGNVCWTRPPRYCSVTCVWTRGRARPVRDYMCLSGNTNVLQSMPRHCAATCSQTRTVRSSQVTVRPVSVVSRWSTSTSWPLAARESILPSNYSEFHLEFWCCKVRCQCECITTVVKMSVCHRCYLLLV